MRKLVLLVAALLASLSFGVFTAEAGPITLSAVALNDPLQQQTNNPCVLGGNDCNSRRRPEIPDFTQTPTGNNNVNISWDLESPAYSVGAIRLLFGNNFRVGLDFSQAQGQADQILGLFAMTIDGVVQDLFVGPAAVPPTPAGNAGNGFADYVLTGFNLAPFAPNQLVRFHATMPISNDGPDQAFLIAGVGVPPPPPPPPQVPEPASLILIGSGLVLIGAKLRKS